MNSLLMGKSRSCGCLMREVSAVTGRKNMLTHGMRHTPTYSSWQAMKARCQNTAHTKYPQWGGRGIMVCDRWQTFEGFLLDMGERPSGTTIDRIDNNGNYEPGNCRWSTAREQANNRKKRMSPVLITANGVTRTRSEWSELTGMSNSHIAQRLKLGWSPEDAVSRPVQRWKNRRNQDAR